MTDTIKTTMDGAGRIVLPKNIRERAGLQPGSPLNVSLRDGRVEIEPAPQEVKLVRRGRFWTAVPLDRAAPISTADIRAALDTVRDRGDR